MYFEPNLNFNLVPFLYTQLWKIFEFQNTYWSVPFNLRLPNRYANGKETLFYFYDQIDIILERFIYF